MKAIHPADLTYFTADLPGIGGVLKQRPEDFLVDEVSAYEPCGEGDHLYMIVEKRRRLTTDVVRYLAKHFGVSRTAVGFAGLKDKHAVTRQAFTVEHADAKLVDRFEDEHIKILLADFHRNKIKRGHLRGNRFVIKVREVEPTAVLRAKPILDQLAEHGAPNFLGEQRFGYRFQNHELGRLLLLGDYRGFLDMMLGQPRHSDRDIIQQARAAYDAGDYHKALESWPTVHRFERQAVGPLSRGASAADAVNGIDSTQRHLLVSSCQSAVFNNVLDRRLREGNYELLEGDLAFKHDSRGVFHVEHIETERPRYAAQAISPTGPMWGRKMQRPTGRVLEWETEELATAGLSEDLFVEGEYTPDGSRRAMRMPVTDASVAGGVDEHGAFVKVSFELPRGCFATTVMREIMKDGSNADDYEAD